MGIPEMIIKYRGVFDQQALFDAAYDWLRQNSYEVHEKKYKHKAAPPEGAEQEVAWDAERKVNHFIKYGFTLEFKFWETRPVEVNGEQKHYGRLNVIIQPRMEVDHNERFKKAGLSGLFDFFTSYIYKQDLDIIYGDTLYYRGYELHKKIKEQLDLETQSHAW